MARRPHPRSARPRFGGPALSPVGHGPSH
jgi:hypothetical protein